MMTLQYYGKILKMSMAYNNQIFKESNGKLY